MWRPNFNRLPQLQPLSFVNRFAHRSKLIIASCFAVLFFFLITNIIFNTVVNAPVFIAALSTFGSNVLVGLTNLSQSVTYSYHIGYSAFRPNTIQSVLQTAYHVNQTYGPQLKTGYKVLMTSFHPDPLTRAEMFTQLLEQSIDLGVNYTIDRSCVEYYYTALLSPDPLEFLLNGNSTKICAGQILLTTAGYPIHHPEYFYNLAKDLMGARGNKRCSSFLDAAALNGSLDFLYENEVEVTNCYQALPEYQNFTSFAMPTYSGPTTLQICFCVALVAVITYAATLSDPYDNSFPRVKNNNFGEGGWSKLGITNHVVDQGPSTFRNIHYLYNCLFYSPELSMSLTSRFVVKSVPVVPMNHWIAAHLAAEAYQLCGTHEHHEHFSAVQRVVRNFRTRCLTPELRNETSKSIFGRVQRLNQGKPEFIEHAEDQVYLKFLNDELATYGAQVSANAPSGAAVQEIQWICYLTAHMFFIHPKPITKVEKSNCLPSTEYILPGYATNPRLGAKWSFLKW